jgi:NAD(P)-dependent dehydrogenase (short-subunit alcohol dehydrogenase family)
LSYNGRKDAAEKVVASITERGGKAKAYQANVALEDAVVELFKKVDADFGPLTCLINNAGILEPHSRFTDISRLRLITSLNINVIGAFRCAQEAVKRMSTAQGGKGGVIVNMSSMASKLGGAFECVDYAVTKGAIDSMTIGLAKEYAAEGIRVCGLRPGLIYTEIHARAGEPGRVDRHAPTVPMKRGGTAEEVAEAALWLASDSAGYITGVTVDVAGGRGL